MWFIVCFVCLIALLSVVSARFQEGVATETSAVKYSPEEYLAQTDRNAGPWIVEIEHSRNAVFTETINSHIAAKNHILQSQQSSPFQKVAKITAHIIGETADDVNIVALDGFTLAELQQMPHVVQIHPDMKSHLQQTLRSVRPSRSPTSPPTMIDQPRDWGMDRIDQINLPLSRSKYTAPYGGACGVDVYILDTGIDVTHPEFQPSDLHPEAANRVVANLLNYYGGLEGNIDFMGHGTHVAATVGGNTVGVSPCANLYGLQVFQSDGSAYNSVLISALDYVKTRHRQLETAQSTQNVQDQSAVLSVVNMSLGGSCGTATDCAQNLVVRKVQELARAGIISAVAAGNDDVLAGTIQPAAAVDAVTVAASDTSDTRASFSNYGSSVDVFAPGVDIVSACSSNIAVTEGCSADGYVAWSGTSMASPHVAGLLAQNLKRLALWTQTNDTNNPVLKMERLSQVQQLRDVLLCDAVSNIVKTKVKGKNPAVQTTQSLVQVASDTNDCVSRMWRPVTDAPSAAPSVRPSRSPTVSVTRRPSVTPTRLPSKKPRRGRGSSNNNNINNNGDA